VAVRERRWFCDAHRDQASAEDLEPWRSTLRMTMTTKGVIDLEELEADRQRTERELERRRLAREREQAARREQVAEAKAEQRRRDEWMRAEMPRGLR
jgi:hypothetical protein